MADWITPHENFVPALDKPIFFYWFIALAFKLFGISEWSARLPSALAAVGCIFQVYCFARAQWGRWEALWSALVLLTSIEFFVLARTVILDMTLTFCITLALYAFYSAAQAKNQTLRKLYCLLMYAALGAGTLVKGLVGLIIPGMVIFFYLWFAKRWSVLRNIYLLLGTLLYLGIVAPWYLCAELRNPGYLRYYLWDEHFSRFLTEEFKRSQGWYYYFYVLPIGFLPWTSLLPFVASDLWKKLNDQTLFLTLWVILPFGFFSVSNSQMPHYILPVFPPLAILSARTMVTIFNGVGALRRRVLVLPSAVIFALVLYFIAGWIWPTLLPREIQSVVSHSVVFVFLCAVFLSVVYGAFTLANAKGYWGSQSSAFSCTAIGLVAFLLLIGQLQGALSLHRSAKLLAQNTKSTFAPDSRFVFFDTYLTGMLFYLQLDRPIWIVTKKDKGTLMGSPYISQHRPPSAAGFGQVFFSFEEFNERWTESKQPLRVFVKQKNVPRMISHVGTTVKELARVNEFVVATNNEGLNPDPR